MRPLEHYLARIRAVPARPFAIVASIECDDYSAWWDLSVIYEAPRGKSDEPLWDVSSFVEHHDPLNGHMLLHGHEVLGRRYGEMLLACPPHEMIVPRPEHGAYTFETVDRPRDLEGSDRAWAEELAAGLAAALSVPAWVDGREGPYFSWWDRIERNAANDGDPRAQTNLATAFLEHRRYGTPVEAVVWFRKAAAQGFAEAQYQLGRMLDQGRAVARDAVEAAHWYAQAAAQGHPQARAALALLGNGGN